MPFNSRNEGTESVSMTWRAMSAGPTRFEPSCVEMRVKWHRMTWRSISARPYHSVVFGTKQGVDYRLNTVDHAADTRGPGRKPGASLYTRDRLPHSRGAGRKPGASLYTRDRLPHSRGLGRKPGAFLYTRERLSLSWGPGRKPGASVYKHKRLSLSHTTDLTDRPTDRPTDLTAAGVEESKVGLDTYRVRRCARRVMLSWRTLYGAIHFKHSNVRCYHLERKVLSSCSNCVVNLIFSCITLNPTCYQLEPHGAVILNPLCYQLAPKVRNLNLRCYHLEPKVPSSLTDRAVKLYLTCYKLKPTMPSSCSHRAVNLSLRCYQLYPDVI